MTIETKLDDLVLCWEELWRRGQAPTAEELCRDHPELLTEVRAQIEALRGMNGLLGADTSPSTTEVGQAHPDATDDATTGCRYRILRLHARGGLGEVLVARDEQLNREVALKRIQDSFVHDGDRRERFLREAALTSQLEHPGIVPVYGVGTDGAGRPCYAMRLVQGQTLHEAINRFHAPLAKGIQPLGFHSLAFRQLLGQFVGICNAVAYAHSQGIIHRDLKPANVLLGAYGESLVVDWGLAKRMDETSRERQRPEESEITQGANAPGSPVQTQTGTRMGTPAYMSPEQAAGRWETVGPASDLYSLGAILYVLLSDQPPFKGRSFAEVADKVQRGDFPPPRRVKAGVPAALEAVCLKTMSLRAEDRYASALDLAGEVEHWLADEPVRAWREPWTVRARRWMALHRTLVSSAVAASLVAMLFLAGATWLLARANERERHLTAQAEQQRQDAEESFDEARQAVDDYFTLVSQGKLKTIPGTQPLRRELMLKALDYYKRFAARHADDPRNLARLAGTYTRIGQIMADTGTIADSLSWYDKGRPLWHKLVEEAPDDAEHAYRLADHLDLHAQALRRAGRTQEALDNEEEAIALLARFLEAHPDEDQLERLLGRIYTNLSLMLGTLSRFDEAIRAAQKGMEVRERILRRDPNDHRLRLYHAIAYSNMGVDWADLGNLPEAVRAYERARDFLEQLVEQGKTRPDLIDHSVGADASGQLGVTYYNLANQLTNLDRLGEARNYLEKCRAVQERLVRDNPTVPAHKEMLVRALGALASTRLLLRDDTNAALRDAEHARDLSEQMLREDPKRIVNLTLVSGSWEVLGGVLARLGRRDETRSAMARSREYCDRQTKLAPKEIGTRWSWSSHHGQWATIHREWREPALAAIAVRKVRDLWPREPTQLVFVARQFALCIPLVGKDPAALTAAEQSERRKYADEAMAVLQLAVQYGFKDVEALEKSKDLDSLREMSRFQDLLRVMKHKASKKAP